MSTQELVDFLNGSIPKENYFRRIFELWGPLYELQLRPTAWKIEAKKLL